MYAPQPVFYMGAEDPSAGLMLTWHDYFALLQIFVSIKQTHTQRKGKIQGY